MTHPSDHSQELDLLKSILEYTGGIHVPFNSASELSSRSSSFIERPLSRHSRGSSRSSNRREKQIEDSEDSSSNRGSSNSEDETKEKPNTKKKHHHRHKHHHEHDECKHKRHHRHKHHHHHQQKVQEKRFSEVESSATAKLQEKYQDLQRLLNEQYLTHKNALLEDQLKHSRSLLTHYLTNSRWNTPPAQWADKHLKKTRVVKVPSPHYDTGTQTKGDDSSSNTGSVVHQEFREQQARQKATKKVKAQKKVKHTQNTESENGTCGEHGDDGNVSKLEESMKRVTFANQEEESAVTSCDGSPDVTINTVEREIALKSVLKESDHSKKKTKVKKQQNPSKSSKPKDKELTSTKNANEQNPAPPNRKRATIVLTDSHLESTTNDDIKQWLLKKRRIERKKLAAQRAKDRAFKKEQEKVMEFKLHRLEESAVEFDKWRHNKDVEIRLLRKRERISKIRPTEYSPSTPVNMSPRSKTPGSRPQTPRSPSPGCGSTNLKPTPKPSPNETPKGESNDGDHPNDGKKQTEEEEKKKTVQEADIPDTLRNNIQTQKIAEEIKRQSKIAKEAREKALRGEEVEYGYKKPVADTKVNKAKQNSIKKKKAKEEEERKKREEEESMKKRISYEDWLKVKKQEDEKRRRKEKKIEKEKLKNLDIEDIIPNLAKERIERVSEGKGKRIDSGLNKSNENDESKSETETNEQNGSESKGSPPTPKYVWKSKGESPDDKDVIDKVSDANRSFPRARPTSSQSGSARPTSATSRLSAKVPNPPRPSRSPVPPRNRTDNITEDHPNPFTSPVPPHPRSSAPNVPAFRRQQFGKQKGEKVREERPEPQGSDQPATRGHCSGTAPPNIKVEDIDDDSLKRTNTNGNNNNHDSTPVSDDKVVVEVKKSLFLTSIE